MAFTRLFTFTRAVSQPAATPAHWGARSKKNKNKTPKTKTQNKTTKKPHPETQKNEPKKNPHTPKPPERKRRPDQKRARLFSEVFIPYVEQKERCRHVTEA